MSHVPYYGEDWDILTGRRDERPQDEPRPAKRPAAPAPAPRPEDELWAYA